MSNSNRTQEDQALEADGSRLVHRLKSETDAIKREQLRCELEGLIERARRATHEGQALGRRIQEWMDAVAGVIGHGRSDLAHPDRGNGE